MNQPNTIHSTIPTGPKSPPMCRLAMRGQGYRVADECRECGDGPCKFPIGNQTALAIPTIPGTPFAGGHYVGRINIAGAVHALIVAPKSEGERVDIAWHPSRPDVPGAKSFFDGHSNTIAMADAGSALAKWALDLRIGGFDDWYVPSRDELELCYRHLKPTKAENYCYRGDNPSSVPIGYSYMPDAPAQIEADAFKQRGVEAFDDHWYWSSTQYAGIRNNAWHQHFDDGTQYINLKDYEGRCRAVRRFLII